MHTITSLTHARVKQVVQLHNKKNREHHKQFIAEGVRTIQTLCLHKMELVTLFVTEAMLHEGSLITSQDNIMTVNIAVMNKMSCVKTPSGILAVFVIPPSSTDTAVSTPGIVLAGISDPGNMGTLIRTAAAVGIQSVVIVNDSVDPWSPKVIQASAGTIGAVTISTMAWKTLLVKKETIPLIALVVDTQTKLNSTTMQNGLLVIGNEAHGIPCEWLADCEYQMTLPMPGGVESLNAAVAGSIAMYLACTTQSIAWR